MSLTFCSSYSTPPTSTTCLSLALPTPRVRRRVCLCGVQRGIRDDVEGRLLVGVGPAENTHCRAVDDGQRSEETCAVVVDDLRDVGDLSGEGARFKFEEDDCSPDVG